MKIATKFEKETIWRQTREEDLLRIIEEELKSKEAALGTLEYVKEVCSKGKTVSVGSCKFKKLA